MLTKLVGLKRCGEMGEWRGLHNHLFCVLLTKYSLGDQIKKNKMAWHVACVWDRRGAYWVLVGIPEGGIPFGRPRHRWEDNIKMDLQEMGCGGFQVAQNRDGWQVLVNQ
jgi:hypothetical protein